MSDTTLYAKGKNGQLTFDGAVVTITRDGVLARLTVGKGEKRIPVHQISAVQLKPAGLVNGFIQFTIGGGVERRSKFGRQSRDAVNDENSVVFHRGQQAAFEVVRDAILAAQVAGPSNGVSAPDAADQLTKLAALHQQGLLTVEEFERQKAKLLGYLSYHYGVVKERCSYWQRNVGSASSSCSTARTGGHGHTVWQLPHSALAPCTTQR